MEALVFNGPHDMSLSEHPKPVLTDQTDVIVRMTAMATAFWILLLALPSHERTFGPQQSRSG
jgi:hypothetical protein